jgi:hypothetical protein
MVAVRVAEEPTVPASVAGSDTPVTGTEAAVTVTLQVAVLLPSTVVTVIIALPAPMKLTTPAADTVATDELLVDHVTALFVAVDGLMVGVRVTAGAPTVLLRVV